MSLRDCTWGAVRIIVCVGLAAALAACHGTPHVWPSETPSPTAGGATLPAVAPPSEPSSPTPRATPSPIPSPSPTPARPRATRPPTRIVAPAIGLDARVVPMEYKTVDLDGLPVTQWQLPDYDAGFHSGSACPGNSGNTVLSGHNNLGGEVFRHLADLRAGDKIILYVGRTAFHYTVSMKLIVPEKSMPTDVRLANASFIGPTSDERLTLVTCWPYTGNTHRVIVVALPAG
ncbi:MAG TPA: sortase [Anaerolineae bacterium]|nr:sortase [Anaerolineae bacterium]HOQ98351.1 sortase [Anaerolineae bacterium]HPL26584.1 sortase [Anaerolineae bacterium]